MWPGCSHCFREEGIQALVIEKGNIVNSIYNYPTHQTFFIQVKKLEIEK